MKPSLFAVAVAFTFSSSAFAAPTKAIDEQLTLLKRATNERLTQIVKDIRDRSQETRDVLAPNCSMQNDTLASYGVVLIDIDGVTNTINHSSEVWIDQGAQPVLTFVSNPLASRVGEFKKVVRVVSDSTDTKILSVSMDTVFYKEVLGGSVSSPSYSVQGVKKTENCSFQTMKKPSEPSQAVRSPAKVAKKSPVLK